MTQNFPVADAHCDFLYYMVKNGWDVSSPAPTQAIALPYMLKSNAKLQFFAAWVDADQRKSCLKQCLDLVDAYHRMLAAQPVFTPLTPDFKPDGDKIATVLTIEGGEALEGDVAYLRLFHQLGVRAMTLTWNFSNELASPAMRRGGKGLTERGREVVKEMERIGVALDVSHLGDAGIAEALELSTRPIFASHSNSRAICNHKRCLTDAQIKAIAEQGGVVGVNYYPQHLSATGHASSKDIAAHIAHMVELVGHKHVCFGSDFDGMCDYPEDIHNWSDVPNLIAELSSIGFSDDEIRCIAYDNLRNYIVQFCR